MRIQDNPSVSLTADSSPYTGEPSFCWHFFDKLNIPGTACRSGDVFYAMISPAARKGISGDQLDSIWQMTAASLSHSTWASAHSCFSR